jgi:two-component system sensor histidine kinase MtrB
MAALPPSALPPTQVEALPAPPQMMWTTTVQEFTVATTDTLPSTVAMMGQEAKVITVQKSPSFWGDRLTFASDAAMPISATMPIEMGVEQWEPGAMAQASLVPVPAGVADVNYATSRMGEVVAKDLWQVESRVNWEGELTEASSVAAQPSFWQSAGFQATDVVTAPIQTGGMVVGFVELSRADDLVDEPLGAIRRALGIAAGASALLALAVGLVMSRTLTAPIQNLAQAAALMSSGDLTARAPVVGHDELASLARQFNQMADALHRSFVELAAERDTLRRFVADASHELRTPITALRTFNELLQGPAQEDRNAQAEFLAESHAQIARLEWITRNLLDLSRWDGGMATLVMAEVDVGELVVAALAPFRALAQERRIDLNVMLPASPVVAKVDGPRLGMAVGNLLDNALKFTPEGGTVEVGVCRNEQGVTIWVEDCGMGICADDLPHIFARFYRSPRATQVGSGLGLAIVERIVNAHGATIDVQSQEGVGSRFSFCLG